MSTCGRHWNLNYWDSPMWREEGTDLPDKYVCNSTKQIWPWNMRFLKQEGWTGDRRGGMNYLCFSNQLLEATLHNVTWVGRPSWDETFPFGTAFTIRGILGPQWWDRMGSGLLQEIRLDKAWNEEKAVWNLSVGGCRFTHSLLGIL